MTGDPYKYFRIEARELLDALTRGAMDLDKGHAGKDVIGRMLRQAHTLKGAARIVKQPRIAELSHSIEDVLAPYRAGETPPGHEQVNQLLSLVDGIAASLRQIEPAPPPAAPAGQPTPDAQTPSLPPEEPFQSVRVHIGDMDHLLHGIAEARVHVAALQDQAAAVDQALRLAESPGARTTAAGDELRNALRHLRQSLATATDSAERELIRVQNRAGELRLLPASMIFGTLERAARDAAESTGRRVRFQTSGGDDRLDTHVLQALRGPLVHIVRNAVVHGIEPEAQRLSAGKPPVGLVELTVQRRGSRIAFICRDDGRGIDLQQVRRSALERGLVSEADAKALDPTGAIKLLLRGGVSTTPAVTQVAGRGIGLDVVRETVARLKGEIHADTTPGQGTTIELRVPVSLESLNVLEIEVRDSTVAIPFDSVVQTMRLRGGDIVHSAAGDTVLVDGLALPFVRLEQLLGYPPGNPAAPPAASAVIVQADSLRAAVAVDRVRRWTSVVMRRLPAVLGRVDLVIGASFNSSGDPQLVLDPAGIVSAARNPGAALAEPAPPPRRPRLLVIDDSLTTRTLEQRILEAAGYDVDLAASGEEALGRARQQRYSLFLVDVEMPGMDGFEFVERARADAALRDIPSILVTSRSSAEDRLRGQKTGARAYIVKSEFDETEFLRTIRRLIG